MELAELLDALDRTTANLLKLEAIWDRAGQFMPSGPSAGSDPEYDDLRRSWDDLLPGLPAIDGWTITERLPDVDDIGRQFIDYGEIGEPPFPLWDAMAQPGKDLAEYRYRLNRTRRRASRDRLASLISKVDASLPMLLNGVDRRSTDFLGSPLAGQLRDAFGEIERLMGDSTRRSGRWSDLHRHLSFGEGHDWHDISELDWPSTRPDVEAAGRAEADPLQVPQIDLGIAASADLTGVTSSSLPWAKLDPQQFERLLFNLLTALPHHQNVQWLQRTNAADRGRDLSCERVTDTGAGNRRTERTIIQAKHWQSKSVGLAEVSANVEYLSLIEGPPVRILIIATSGTFTADAIAWIDKHNEAPKMPYIEMWPHSHIEMLLAQRPALAADAGLR